MRALKNLPVIDPTQKATVTFDFGVMLPTSVTIGFPVVINVTLAQNSPRLDRNPSAIITVAPQIGSSPNNGLASKAVLIQIGNLVPGVTYDLQCTAAASNGDTPSVWTQATCVAPG